MTAAYYSNAGIFLGCELTILMLTVCVQVASITNMPQHPLKLLHRLVELMKVWHRLA